jgi:NTE family protein
VERLVRPATTAPQPAVGVALSSGGAAGLAHIGVLSELTRAGVCVAYVAGTSAGAMVGAAYAAGQLAGLRAAMCRLTHRRVLWMLVPTWPHAGLLDGRRPMEFVRPYVGKRIEALRLPYAAVATDLRSGGQVVLRQGSVVDAVRASTAIPGLFTPHRCQGQVLVDGGLVNPVPVDVARQLGAQFVIAVSVLGSPNEGALHPEPAHGLAAQLLARFHHRIDGRNAPRRPAAGSVAKRAHTADEEGPGLFDVLSKASTIVQAHIAAGRLREQPADHLIAIALPEIGVFDFHRAAEVIAAGRTAARRALPEIRAKLVHAAPLYRKVTRWLDETAGRLTR